MDSQLLAYLPQLLQNALPGALEPHLQRFQAAVLLADISGFTALTEELAKRGPAGAEDLSHILNEYYGQLVDIVLQYQGDVVKFAGDALLAIWRFDDDKESATHAVEAAIKARQKLENFEKDGKKLYLHFGISVGEVSILHLGGLYNRWEFMLAGQPIEELGFVTNQAKAGEIALTDSAWQLVSHEASAQKTEQCWILNDLKTEVPITTIKKHYLDEEKIQILKPYVPGAISSRLAAGQTSWLAELRRVTVLFVNLPDLTYQTPLAEAQRAFQALQHALYQLEGSLNKISVDDKGTTVVMALGLPPLAHSDDPARGLLTALDVQKALSELNWRSSIGVTSGRVFCGTIGNDHRREYTMIGDSVNLAARLMQAAKGLILCDITSFEAAKNRLEFEPLAPIKVKGKSQLIPIYRPLNTKEESQTNSQMVGRLEEKETLAEALEILHEGQSSLIFIEGEPGIGKSRLVQYLLERANESEIKALVGAGDSIERSAAYHAWRSVFRQLFSLEQLESIALGQLSNRLEDSQKEQVLSELQKRTPHLVRLAPLLDAVLPLELLDNELTSQMHGQVRADNTNQLLLALLRSQGSFLLILEDIHWLDSASWALLRLVEQLPIAVVLATRPLIETNPDANYLLHLAKTERLKLEVLPSDQIEDLVCQQLGVTKLSTAVSEFIRAKAEGHPFFSEELAYALRDSGLIEMKDGICQLAPGAGDLKLLDFPDTIEGVITSRIDRLKPPEQLAVKVASVLGRVFAFQVLRDVYPIEADKPQLNTYLREIERLDITKVENPEPELAYVFKHIITQEVAYNLMSFSQRRELHKVVAEWYEKSHDDLEPFYSLLAYHYSKAEDRPKAIEYLGKAGEQAVRTYANFEAVKFLEQVLTLETDRFKRAHWERLLGTAYFGLGELAKARQHLSKAVSLLGYPVAKPLILGIIFQAFIQISHLLFPFLIKNHKKALNANGGRQIHELNERMLQLNERKLEGVRAYDLLLESFYFANDLLPVLFCGLSALNLAEWALPSNERARAYAVMSVAAGLSQLRPLAERYQREASALAKASNHVPTQIRVIVATAAYRMGLGKLWSEIEADLAEAMDKARQLGDRRQLGEAAVIASYSTFSRADFAKSDEHYKTIDSVAKMSGDNQQQSWSFTGWD